MRHCLFSGLSIALWFYPFIVEADPLHPENTDRLFNHHQQQQQEQQQKLEAKSPDVHLAMPGVKAPLRFPEEHPCFPLNNVTLTGQDALPHWVPLQHLANQAIGHCLGAEGINLLVADIQNRLISHGWITTRVLVPAQDLSTGTLQLVVLPGKVQHIRFAPQAYHYSSLYTAVPTHQGDVLDLRDIEQGLENLQRLPTVKATVEMVPGDAPGDTVVVIDRQQSRFWRLGAWADNSSTSSTGKNQAGIMLALDNPLALSDLFYLTATRDTGFRNSKNTTNYSAHYSVPFGYWQVAATGSDYEYLESVAGNYNDIQYRGKNKSLNVQLSRVLYRNASAKTTASYDVNVRETRNFIANTEIEGQKRRTSSWKAALNHRHSLGQRMLTAGASYQQGMRWFGALYPKPSLMVIPMACCWAEPGIWDQRPQ